MSLLAILSIAAEAQTAQIEKSWLEFNVTRNGKTGINIHTKFSIKGHKGKKVKAISYVYEDNKKKWMDVNNQYRSNDGQVSASYEGVPKYDDTVFHDFVVFIPNDELHMAPGKHNYYIQTQIWSTSMNKFLAVSEYMSFVGTGNMSNPWLLTHQDPEERDVYNNYMVTHYSRIKCGCDRGLCSPCGGTGRNPYDWRLPCICNGTGKCFLCYGKGFQESQTNYYPLQYMNMGYLKFYYDTFAMNQSSGQIRGVGAVVTVYPRQVTIDVAGKKYQFYYNTISYMKEEVRENFAYSLKDKNNNDMRITFGPLSLWCNDPVNGGILSLSNEEGSDNHKAFNQKQQIFRKAHNLQY